MGRYATEDGPEDTDDYPGGVIPSGHNGSFVLYVPDRSSGSLPPPAIAERLAELRLRFACQAAARPR